ncbi:MAG: phosphoglycerate mutase [Hydrogenophaga sp.]
MPATSADSPRHWLVPFAAASAPECQALLPGLYLPNLHALLALLAEHSADRGDDHHLSPPHERALARAIGLTVADGTIPWAAAHSATPAVPQAWFSLCHYQVGMDRVLMLPGAGLGLDAADSHALFDAFAPLCAEDGITLRWDSPTEWHASGEPLRGVACASLDRVSGRHARDWMPDSSGHPNARLLQRLQSEAQMLFYSHPVHDARAARGQTAINGFWVHGAGALDADTPLRAPPAIPDNLRQAALRGDWPAWQTAWQALDSGDMATLLAAARRGEPVTLTLCGERHARSWTTPPASALTRLGRSIQRLFGTAPISDILKDL